MKAHLDIAHTGTLGDNRKTIQFDEDATDVLQGILIDLYTDLELACIREIFTNARDSHVEAGQVLPVEVDLPSPLRMAFVVRDRGVGLDPDDIDRIFKYGASTKRDSDDAVGMLGLGLKAPLGYVSQFTLVAVKHGLKSTVLVTRNERGGGAYDIVDTCATDEPNGVEVTIPTSGFSVFSDKARKFFQFVEPGIVLVNGSEPETFPRKRDLVLDPDVIVTTSKDVEVDYIVMGNVPYPLPYSEKDLVKGTRNAHAIVRVPIGSVDFTPNREALRLTKRTLETLHEARMFIAGGVEQHVQNSVSAASSHLEALRVAVEWRASFMRFPNLRYGGLDVPEGFSSHGKQTHRWEPGSEWNTATSMSYVDAAYVIKDTTLHVVGSKLYGIRKDVKKKVDLYLEDQGLVDTIKKVVFYPEPLTEGPWLDGVPTVDYDTIKAIKLPTDASPRATRLKGAYRVVTRPKAGSSFDGVERWTAVKDIALLPVVYVMAGNNVDRQRLRSRLRGVTLVIVEKPRLASFKKDIPSAIPVEDYARASLVQFTKLTPAQSYALHVGSGGPFDGHALGKLASAKVLDPDLRAALRSGKAVTQEQRYEYARVTHLAMSLGVPNVIPEVERGFALFTNRVDCINRRYGLVAKQNPYNTRACDVLEYVNLVYRASVSTLVQSMFTDQKIQPDTSSEENNS